MLSPSLLPLGVISLASFAQAVPQTRSASDSYTIHISRSTGMTIGIIVAIAVVVLCGVCGCCGLIWWFCARHRENMRRIRAENGMTPVVPLEQTRKMPPLTSGVQSNTVGPPGSNPPGYFDQAMGSPGSRFDPKMSPYMPSAATITPMTPGPQWQQPYHMGNQLPMPPLPQHAHEMPAHPAPVAELKG